MRPGVLAASRSKIATMTTEDGSSDPDLRHYLRVIRRRKGVVVLATAVVVLTALGVSFAQTPVYQATAQLLITPTASTSSVLNQSGFAQDPTATDIQTQMQIITSAPVKEIVRSQLGAAPKVSVSEVGQTTVVDVRAASTIASQAAEVANAYANAYLDSQRAQAINNLQAAGTQVQDKIDALGTEIDTLDAQIAGAKDPAVATNLSPQRDELVSQQGLFKQQLAQLQLNASVATSGGQIVTPATTPTSPSSPRPTRSAILALAVGLLFGVGVCFLLDYLDDSVRSREDADRAARGLPDLGLIPRISGWKNVDHARVVSVEEPKSAASEAYRTLRTSIQFVALDRPLRIIHVTSAGAGEGKTTTLANLGVAMANAGDRVCMCCCDLRRPRIHEFFGLDNAVGFTSVILGQESTSAAIQEVPNVRRLSLLASGPLPPNPSELLASERAVEVIRSLAAMYDVVLLDSPPVLPVTDAAIISAVADATIIVINMGESTRREISRTVEILDQVHASLVGTVLNAISEDTADGYYRYGEYYGAKDDDTKSEGFLEPVPRP
jgi:polysaccharide biosynthesis transport protein